MKKYSVQYNNIITLDNLLQSWQGFLRGRKRRNDVMFFGMRLIGSLCALHKELLEKTYVHGGYVAFNISDPKPRSIHKAAVRDRVLYHLLYRKLYPCFDKRFIAQSFSCRENKGTHKALEAFRKAARSASRNNTVSCYVLKCDVKKFFASIDQSILLRILEKYIEDRDLLWLIGRIVSSFSAGRRGIGLPLGNLTSQLFVNVYMNELDMFIKHTLKARHYIRYADDFVVMSESKAYLENMLPEIKNFLAVQLGLSLHENKVYIKTYASGVDFLGWIHFPQHRQLRTATRRRLERKLKANFSPETVASYKGLLGHGNTHKLQKQLGLI